eukprot:ANDGO_05594.mRNA.1 Cilia- and flagella-associated protein 99
MLEKDLIRHCTSLISEFNPNRTTVDAFAEEYFENQRLKDDENACMFLTQILYNLTRYSKLLDRCMDVFFASNKEAQRSDDLVYRVLFYLAYFRLDELGFSSFSSLVLSNQIPKMLVLLRFMWNEDDQHSKLKPIFLQYFDVTYVDENLISAIAAFAPNATDLIHKMESKMTGSSDVSAMDTKNTVTVPQPFQLTRPRLKILPEPMEIETVFKASPVPKSLYEGPKKLEKKLQEAKEQARQAVESKMRQASAPRLRTAERSRPVVISESDTAASSFKAKDLEDVKRKMQQIDAPVRMNAAAILREDTVYKKKQAQDAEVLRKYESDLRDASEFYEWQSRTRAQDDAERNADVERRKLEILLSDMEAREAREKKQAELKQLVEKEKEATEKEMNELKKKQQMEVIDKKIAAEELKQLLAEKRAEALRKVQEEKEREAEKIRIERREAEIRIAEELEAERQRKENLIRQIRALEKVPSASSRIAKVFDPTESSGIGLLDEMSLAELHERLSFLKEQKTIEEEQKRQEIISDKQQKELVLKQKAESIAHFRNMARQDAVLQREKKLEEERQKKELADIIRNKELQALSDKLARKRDAAKSHKEQLQEEERLKRQQSQFLAADKAAREEQHFRRTQAGVERQTVSNVETQERAMDAATLMKNRLSEQKTLNSKRDADQKNATRSASDEAFVASKSERKAMDAQLRSTMRQNAAAIRLSEKNSSRLKNGVAGDVTAERRTELESQLVPSRYH